MKWLIVTISVFLSFPTSAANLSAESAESSTPLLELYSSEGCSSCPPADRWLGDLKSDAGLFKEFVPLAFQVDYWDYLGWKDENASAEYTARQRDLSAGRQMYTPEFFLNGREWRARSKAALSRGEKVGRLKLEKLANDEVAVRFTPTSDKRKKWVIYVVRFANGVRTDVARGENAGENLSHEFMVTELANAEAKSTDGKSHTVRLKLAKKSPTEATRTGLAAWVVEFGSQIPRQAVAFYEK